MSSIPESNAAGATAQGTCIRLRENVAQPELSLGLISDAIAYQDAVASGQDTSALIERFLQRFDTTEDLARAVLSGAVRVRITGAGLVTYGFELSAGLPLLPAPVRARAQHMSMTLLVHADIANPGSRQAAGDVHHLVQFIADLRAWCMVNGVNLQEAFEASAHLTRFERETGQRPH